MLNRTYRATGLLVSRSFANTGAEAELPADKMLKISGAERPEAMRAWEVLVKVNIGRHKKRPCADASAARKKTKKR
jgi:hypothetical protein